MIRNRKPTVTAAVLGGVAVIVLGLRLFAGGGRAERVVGADSIPTVAVTTAEAVSEPLTDYAEATGTVRPIEEAKIAPKIMSTVEAVYVREGDHVRHGQALMKLEAADLSTQVSQASAAVSATASQAQAARRAVTLQQAQSVADVARAQAELAAAKEQLAMAMSGPRKQERSQAHLSVAQAQAQFKNAEIELSRMKRLYDQDVIPKQRVDQADMSYEVAKAQYEAAQQQADMVEEGSRTEEIRTAEARVRQADDALTLARAAVVQNKIREANARAATSEVRRASAALAYARVQAGYATISAPMDGIVTRRTADPGDTVSPGVPIVTIENNALYRLEASVSETELPFIRVGDKVDIRVDAGNIGCQGHISEIAPSGDPESRKFLVKADLPAQKGIFSGQFGRISFRRGTRTAVTVPQEAVRSSTGLTTVMTAGDDGKAHMQVVKAGKTYKGRTEVISGLTTGETVITSNLSSLVDGAPIRKK